MADTAFDGTPVAPAGQQQGGQQDQGTTTGGWGGSPGQETNSTGRAQEGTLQTGAQPGQRQQQATPHPDQRQTQRQAPEHATEYWKTQYAGQAREGESFEDFQERFGRELSGRVARTARENGETRRQIQALQEQNAHLLNQLQPLLEHFQSIQQRELTQRQMAEIPDDPIERNNWLLEQNLRFQHEQAQTAEQREQERIQWEQGQAELEAIDSTWSQELAVVSQDPEFVEDFQAMTTLDLWRVQQHYGPEAEEPFVDPMTGRETGETKAQALVRITQRNMMREMAVRGRSVRETVAEIAEQTRRAFNIQRQQQPAAPQQQRQGNGNGNGSQTAQRLAQETQRNQMARTLSSPAGARGGNSGAGEGFDPGTASPEEVQQAIRNGFDYHGWLKSTYGQANPWGEGWGS